jgi:hypothetical protein
MIMRELTPFFLFAFAFAFGCGAGESDPSAAGNSSDVTTGGPTAEEAQACAKGSVGKNLAGDSVVKCTVPFADAPMVHLPADQMAGDEVSFYAGGSQPDGDFEGVLWTRDGKSFVPVDNANKPIEFTDDGSKALPKGMHAPSNRLLFTIYRFTGKLGKSLKSQHGDATAIHLTDARPVVEIDGCALDSRLLGTWEGTVSERLVTPSGYGPFTKNFDPDKRIPIHITFDSLTPAAPLADFSAGGVRMKDALTFTVNGTIDNFDKDVTVDGKLYPSLTAMDVKNPFYSAKDGKVSLYRLGNMHGLINDAHWALNYPNGSKDLTPNGMSQTMDAFQGPSFLFDAGVSSDEYGTLSVAPHLPYNLNGHTVELKPVHIGEKLGQCAK